MALSAIPGLSERRARGADAPEKSCSVEKPDRGLSLPGRLRILITMQPGFVFLASPRPQHGLGRQVVAVEPVAGVTSFQDLDRLIGPGGLVVGYVGYTARRHTLDLPAGAPPLDFPEIWFARYEHWWLEEPGTGFREFPADRPSPPPLSPQEEGRAAFVRILEDEAAYRKKIRKIQHHLRQGDIYQANYTVPSEWRVEGSPWGLFRRLLARQPTAFGAFLQITEEHAVLSFSPELFFHLSGDRIRTVPMKGTRPRGKTPEEDHILREALRTSPKDRAENVMIVDLLRNDLGRIARPGTVTVPVLFAVESFPTVHQMISVVEARLLAGQNLSDVLTVLFPGGSVTGAPKKRAVEILSELEVWERGVYTGAIGVVYPWGEAVFSLAIRTLQVAGTTALYGAGGGIVLDSDPEEEWRELWQKMAFLNP